MIRFLLTLWPRCGIVRKGSRCTRDMWHGGRHKYPRKIKL